MDIWAITAIMAINASDDTKAIMASIGIVTNMAIMNKRAIKAISAFRDIKAIIYIINNLNI